MVIYYRSKLVGSNFLIEILHDEIIQFSIGSETTTTKMLKKVGIEDVLTGDKQFDQKMLLKAETPVQLLLLLDTENRQRIERLMQNSIEFTFNQQSFSVVFDANKVFDSKQLADAMQDMTVVSSMYKKIAAHTDEKQLLNFVIKSIEKETNEWTKLLFLKQLAENFTMTDAKVQKLLKKLLSDENMHVRIEAAKYLQDGGEEFLISLLNPDRRIYMAEVVNALRICGTQKSVPLLFDFLHNVDAKAASLKTKLTKAVYAIQKRTNTDNVVGMLSVRKPKGEEGGLSTTDDTPQGGLSIDLKS